MFSTLKSHSRSRNKDSDEKRNVSGQADEKDESDVSCASQLKCQQSLRKCSFKSCRGQSSKDKYPYQITKDNSCNVNNNDQTNCLRHSDVFLPVSDKFSDESSSYVIVKRTDVYIERDEDGNLGLTLQGGIHQNPEFSRPLVVTYVRPGGPTDKEGTIQPGDRLLAIDGVSLEGATSVEAYNILHRHGESACLRIEYDVTRMAQFTGPLLVEMECPHPQQLGLTLTNTPHNAAVLIDEVKVASVAERCGALHPGDQILSVNDTRIEGSRMAATDVYKLLRIGGATHSNLLLEIMPSSALNHRRFDHNSDNTCQATKPYDVYPHNYYEVPNEFIVPASVCNNSISGEKQLIAKRMIVTLHSDDRLGYGLSIYSMSNSDVYGISAIITGGPAYMCEQLQVNDRILTINGLPISGVTSNSQPLHKVPGVALGMVELDIEYNVSSYIGTENVVKIELKKYNKNNLGITMTGSSECMLISEIKQGSVADRCGLLAPGDKIISINHRILAECSVPEALNILHSSSDTVSLEIEKSNINPEFENNNVEYTVQFNKQNGPLGITISGSEDMPAEIFISSLSPGGLAEKTGALHTGDRVLEINEADVSNVLLSEAVTVLQKTGDKVLFKVSRNTTGFNHNYIDHGNHRIYGSPGLVSDDSAVESWESSTQQDASPNETPLQHVQSPENEKYLDYFDSGGGNLENFVFSRSNTLKLNHNAISKSIQEPVYSNIPHDAVQQMTYECVTPFPQSCKYLPMNFSENHQTQLGFKDNELDSNNMRPNYVYDLNNIDEIFNIVNGSEADPTESLHDVRQVVLYKDPLYDDFGFSISDGLYERGVFINRIRNGGPADKSGLLQPFDRIIQVNGVKTTDFDCCLTVPLIASSGEKITLKVKRKKQQSVRDTNNHMKTLPWNQKPAANRGSTQQPMKAIHTI